MRALLVALGGLLAVILAGCGPAGAPPADLTTPAPPATTAPAVPGVVGASGAHITALRYPRLGIASRDTAPMGVLADDSPQVPPLDRVQQFGWFKYAPTAGDLGPAVLFGHINGGGRPGVFAHLTQARVGDRVEVDRSDGQIATFTVVRIQEFPKAEFKAHRLEIYGNLDHAGLRMVTCSGQFDSTARSYKSQTVVYADLTELRRP